MTDSNIESRKMDLAVHIYRLETVKSIQERQAIINDCESTPDFETILLQMPGERIVRYYKAKERTLPHRAEIESNSPYAHEICRHIDQMDWLQSSDDISQIDDRLSRIPNFEQILFDELPGKWIYRYLNIINNSGDPTSIDNSYTKSPSPSNAHSNSSLIQNCSSIMSKSALIPSGGSTSDVYSKSPDPSKSQEGLFQQNDLFTSLPPKHSRKPLPTQERNRIRTADRPVQKLKIFNQFGRAYNPGAPLDLGSRMRIIEMSLAGCKVNEIARELSISHGCVSRIMKRFRLTGQIASFSDIRRMETFTIGEGQCPPNGNDANNFVHLLSAQNNNPSEDNGSNNNSDNASSSSHPSSSLNETFYKSINNNNEIDGGGSCSATLKQEEEEQSMPSEIVSVRVDVQMNNSSPNIDTASNSSSFDDCQILEDDREVYGREENIGEEEKGEEESSRMSSNKINNQFYMENYNFEQNCHRREPST